MKTTKTNAGLPQQATTLTVDQALQQALAHHRDGQLQNAARIYRAILQSQPHHPDANHNLGVLAVQVKQPAVGLPYFKAALEANPNIGQYWLSYIDALILSDQTDAARQVLEQGRKLGLQGPAMDALLARVANGTQTAEQGNTVHPQAPRAPPPAASADTKKVAPSKQKPARQNRPVPVKRKAPDHQELKTLMALFEGGRYLEATTLAQKMTERFPQNGFGWKALGAAFMQLGRLADALAPMKKAAALTPGDAEAHRNLGVIFRHLGRPVEAETSCRRALQIKPRAAETHNLLGAVLIDLGRFNDAAASYRRSLEIKPDDAETHSNLGNALKDLGRFDDAVASYRQALVIRPDFAEVHYNLGIALADLMQLDNAVASYQRALAIKPDFVEAHDCLGSILRDLGQFDDAVASYRRALEIKPDYTEAHNNLGNVMKDLGHWDDAVASYRRALEISPDYAVAHFNLGAVLSALGLPDAALASHRRALEIKPDFTDALDQIALLRIVQGKFIDALNTIKQSLLIKETVDAKRILAVCAKRLRFTHNDSEMRATMVRALTEPWGRPSELARSSIDLVKLDPGIGGCVTRAAGAWPVRLSAQELFGPNGLTALAADPLLNALLVSAPISDIGMERFLTMARRAMLEAAIGSGASGAEVSTALSFYSALARQCFINEYLFAHSDDEIRKAGELRDALAAALDANTQVPALWPVAVAAYFPLGSLPFAPLLPERQWPEEVASVLVQQVHEPAEEWQLRATIPRLTDIEDDVSLLVQSQYEVNPYPRWVKAAPAGKAKSVGRYLGQKFPFAFSLRSGKSASIDILIAGCGTGQHSIGTAQQFLGAQVLAVDLSLSSLGYAKRKTRELGLTSIEYAQADIMKLGSLGRSFDVIESCGVLHHLGDPWAGWQVLLSLLRPGGCMKLGFYSEVARRNIVRIRSFIAEHGYSSTTEDIRRCRQDLLDLDKSEDFGTTTKSYDFFSISACRDLLFHVQEHRMTLTGIDAFLRENNLAFIGFELEDEILKAYKQRFPDDRAATNLAKWQIFENENPDTFIGMYQFWVQKGN